MKKHFLALGLIFLICIIFTLPFYHKGFFPTHDGEWAIVRLSEMRRELLDGQLPPRWSEYLNHGYGYPLFSFTYPFPYYLGAVIHFLGLGLTDSIKALFISSVFLSGMSMYFLGAEFTGPLGGLLAAIFYTAAPFRLTNLYVRGSLGESLVLVLFPILCLLGYRYLKKPTVVTAIFCSITLAILILTHNISALLFFPFWLAYLVVILFVFKKPVFYYLGHFVSLVILLGLGLSAYFWIPATLEKKYIYLSRIPLSDISANFVSISELISSNWSFGLRPPLHLGFINILAAFLAVALLIINHKKSHQRNLIIAVYLTLSAIIAIIFTTPISGGFWKLPPLSWVDFPWRLLTFLTFIIAFLSAFISQNKASKIPGLILAVVVVFANYSFAHPENYFQRTDGYYATNDATTTSMDELMPLVVKEKPKNIYQSKVEITTGELRITNLLQTSKSLTFDVQAASPALLRLNTIFFPGRKVYIDGAETNFTYNNPTGVLEVDIPTGNYRVVSLISETPIRIFSDLVTAASLFIIAVISLTAGKRFIIKKDK